MSERDRIITPYDADAWDDCLATFGLVGPRPDLTHWMRFGFPLGNLAPILATSTPPNYPAAVQHMAFIREYVDEQVALGRMTGPYSRARVEAILGSPFISSPLSVVPKAQGKLRMVQNCSFGDEYGLSVNGRIDADLYPTRWGTAARVAELVSTK